MVFKGFGIKGLKTKDAKKKFLGALVIIAFVAFFANVATRYIVISETDLILVSLIAIAIIFALLFLIEKRTMKKRRIRKTKKITKRGKRRTKGKKRKR